MSASDHRRRDEILSFAAQIEQAGDVLARNFLPHVLKQLKRAGAFPEPGQGEIGVMLERLSDNLRMAGSLFMTEDARIARLLTDEKIVFRDAELQAARAHFESMASAPPIEAQASALRLDLLRDLKLINSHIVAASAYPVLERTGELLPSRRAANTSEDG